MVEKIRQPNVYCGKRRRYKIGDVTFRSWGDKHVYYQKNKNTFTYIKTFQSREPIENLMGEIVYPILDVYVDICHGRKRITYKS